MHGTGGLGESNEFIKADATEGVMDILIGIGAINHFLSRDAKAVCGRCPEHAVVDTAIRTDSSGRRGPVIESVGGRG